MILIGYKKCTTCKGIEKMLEEKNIKYTYREIDKDVPTVKELRSGTRRRVLT
ncbi:MAG: arsenate reductase family protein [Fenollaria timonensis]